MFAIMNADKLGTFRRDGVLTVVFGVVEVDVEDRLFI